MNFDFSDDQKALRDQASRFLRDRCPPKTVRRILEGGDIYDRDLWKGVAEMGWTATAIPEEYGGLGLGYLELCVIAEELGRAVAPIPFASSVYLATEAILLAGSAQQKEKYLPRLAAGEIIGTFANAEGVNAPSPRTIKTTFKNGKVDGVKAPVADGLAADFAVVLVRTGESGDRALSLVIVDLTGDGVTRKAEKTVDRRADRPKSRSTAPRANCSARRARAGASRPRFSTAQPCCSPSSRLAARMPALRWPRTMRSTAMPSADRSPRIRRSSTSWPTCM